MPDENSPPFWQTFRMSAADSSDKSAGKPGSGQAAPEAETTAVAGGGDQARKIREIGGPTGPDPTRYGDWERKGRCIDF
jgi:hypothetical protein